ncbi:hypothetical protein CEXT_210041 [Caerostris extrusa]|uniref:LAGLIDADG homing endonuclease n=1 Tax=Caerostris extrusa TaxID=172846 RepID=A0AAV4R107_CAEEX|nr:hypothetical protein CEXT_210041 [Caerostris extrusa]
MRFRKAEDAQIQLFSVLLLDGNHLKEREMSEDIHTVRFVLILNVATHSSLSLVLEISNQYGVGGSQRRLFALEVTTRRVWMGTLEPNILRRVYNPLIFDWLPGTP